MKVKNFFSELCRYLENNKADQKFSYKKRNLLLLIVITVVWQSFFYFGKIEITSKYRRADATGFNHLWGQKFLYFYYYLDLFPLATTDTNLVYSKEGALNQIKNNSGSLRMEWNHWARFGESARIWMYMPHAWLKGTPEHPEIIFTNYLFFLITLILILVISWIGRKIVLGIIAVFVLGNSPYLIYEIYNHNNVFGAMSVFSILLLILHIPVIWKFYSKWLLLVPVISGVLVGLFHNIRAESTTMIISVLLTYWLFGRSYIQSIMLTVLFGLSYFFINKSIQEYFTDKFNETYAIVKQHGGIPFEGSRTKVHPVWHPLICGLGDYDNKYGYILHDTAVYNLILPMLRKEHNAVYKYPGKTIYTMDEYYDSLGYYYKKPEDIKGFDETAKKLFFNAITNDPVWYGSILIKRTVDFLFNLSPAGIIVYNRVLTVPVSGWIVILLIVGLIYCRRFEYLSMILFTIPIGLSVILVFSAYNNSYQSVFHLISTSFVIYILTGWVMDNYKWVFNKFFKSDK